VSDWKFWDWTAYGCLFVAAVIEAAAAAIGQAPALAAKMPNVFTSAILAFIPLVLVISAPVILLIRHWSFKRVSQKAEPIEGELRKNSIEHPVQAIRTKNEKVYLGRVNLDVQHLEARHVITYQFNCFNGNTCPVAVVGIEGYTVVEPSLHSFSYFPLDLRTPSLTNPFKNVWIEPGEKFLIELDQSVYGDALMLFTRLIANAAPFKLRFASLGILVARSDAPLQNESLQLETVCECTKAGNHYDVRPIIEASGSPVMGRF
jgi:hypothetical protein